MVDISLLSSKEKMALVCLYLARLPGSHDDYRRRNEYFDILSKKYGRKRNSLKNDKDAFDPFFENGRVGWVDKPLQSRSTLLYDIYQKYRSLSIDENRQVAMEVVEEAEKEEYKFFSVKTKNPEQVTKILATENDIEIDGLNILKDELVEGQTIFIVFGGDKGRPEVTWDTGLAGLGVISQPPYDEGYSGRNYKIRINVQVLLDRRIKREDLVPYRNTYDIIGIGPITKWEPNQAISQINEYKAVALMRAMLDICPSIEKDLAAVIDEELYARIKGAAVKLIEHEVDYGESDDAEEQEDFDDILTETYQPDIAAIMDEFILNDKPIRGMVNFINTSKHIIMIGPPGTGKTTLAERACREAVNTNYICGYILTTAVADWSTFDTIGGYMPDKDGRLIFQEGVFLKAIRENKWIIIDEINRAEVDKSFGHLFTVLSGRDVELQFRLETTEGNERNITIQHSGELRSWYDSKKAVYHIGRNWRIIATMNTYDKNSLFTLSYAFMRRFAFVFIPVPSGKDFTQLVQDQLGGSGSTAEKVLALIGASPKKLGPAVVLDLIKYLKSAGTDYLVHGICSIIIPQYEGISLPQIRQLYKDSCSLFNPEDRLILGEYISEFFDIRYEDIIKIDDQMAIEHEE